MEPPLRPANPLPANVNLKILWFLYGGEGYGAAYLPNPSTTLWLAQ
jgi:hypothetical protein